MSPTPGKWWGWSHAHGRRWAWSPPTLRGMDMATTRFKGMGAAYLPSMLFLSLSPSLSLCIYIYIYIYIFVAPHTPCARQSDKESGWRPISQCLVGAIPISSLVDVTTLIPLEEEKEITDRGICFPHLYLTWRWPSMSCLRWMWPFPFLVARGWPFPITLRRAQLPFPLYRHTYICICP